jgi:hypothetical protein
MKRKRFSFSSVNSPRNSTAEEESEVLPAAQRWRVDLVNNDETRRIDLRLDTTTTLKITKHPANTARNVNRQNIKTPSKIQRDTPILKIETLVQVARAAAEVNTCSRYLNKCTSLMYNLLLGHDGGRYNALWHRRFRSSSMLIC